MAKENVKTYKETAVELSYEQLHAVSGGTEDEDNYSVTTESKCPYCGSTQVYKESMQKNIGFTKVLREYKCRKCSRCFWRDIS